MIVGRVVPTRRLSVVGGWFVVATALLSTFVGPWWVAPLLASGVLVSAAMADAALAVSPTEISVSRTLPTAMTRGTVGEVEWNLGNRSTQRVEVAFADHAAPSIGLDRRAGGAISPRGSLTILHRMEPQRRGRFEIGPMTMRCAGPLGLAARQRTLESVDTLRVLPPFRSRRATELRMKTNRVMSPGARASRGRGAGTEFEQLREYVPGDDPRHIDWNATARSTRPIVRSFNLEQHQRVQLLLDCGRLSAGHVDGAPRLEHLMDTALALSVVAARSRDRVGLIAYDDGLRAQVPPAAGQGLSGRLTEAVFGLQTSVAEADHARAMVTATVGERRRGLVVLFTELNGAVVRDALIPALSAHAGRHVVIVVAISDPRLEAWATGAVTDSSELHRSAQAIRAIEERREAVAALEQMGVTVVDDVPGRCAERLVDAYFELKSSGRW